MISEQRNPIIDLIILKIKRLEELTPEEELIYLTEIEKLPKTEAVKIVQSEFPQLNGFSNRFNKSNPGSNDPA